MAKIIPFPNAPKKMSQIVDEILESRMTHRNPAVLRCLKKELKILVEKHFNGEKFSATLVLPPDLSDGQFRSIEHNFQALFKKHNQQMLKRTNALFLDLCMSRMAFCELENQHDSTPEP